MTLDRAHIDAIALQGLEYVGSVELGGVIVIGDPLVIGRNPSNGAYWAGRTAKGTWALFVLPDPDTDAIAEVVAVPEGALDGMWDRYDEAAVAGTLPAGALRVALIDGRRKDDPAVRAAMLEPEPDALPWLVDDGIVAPGHPAEPVIVRTAGEPATLVSIAFGPVPIVATTAPMSEE